MRLGSSTLYFLLTDHLGSTAITATSSGGFSAEMRYYPWGGMRYTYGTTPTSFRYTGQREAEVGLYYYGARYYDSQLGRFVSPDTVIPQQQGTQAWDRYAGMNNNPVKYIDPSGHYGEEVHRDLTYQIVHDAAMNIADEEGFGLNELKAFADYLASEVVRGDMAADMKNPDGTLNFNYAGYDPITPPMTIVDTNTGEHFEDINPHWYTTPQAVDDMQSAENPFDFGIASHEYQDSFAHWQKLGEPETPQGIWGAHFVNDVTSGLRLSESVDNYSINNPVDCAMTNGYTLLVDSFVQNQVDQWIFYGY